MKNDEFYFKTVPKILGWLSLLILALSIFVITLQNFSLFGLSFNDIYFLVYLLDLMAIIFNLINIILVFLSAQKFGLKLSDLFGSYLILSILSVVTFISMINGIDYSPCIVGVIAFDNPLCFNWDSLNIPLLTLLTNLGEILTVFIIVLNIILLILSFKNRNNYFYSNYFAGEEKRE